MMNVNIRTNKKNGETPLVSYMRIGGKNHTINLRLMVKISAWNEAATSTKKKENYLRKLGYTERLLNIEFGVDELKRQNKFTRENVEKLIQDIVLKEKREQLLEQEKLGKEFRRREEKSVKTYITNFVKKMETGETRTVKGELYKHQSIKAWKQFKRVFLDFYDRRHFSWDEIDKNLINRFLTYLEENKYMKKTRDKYLSFFKQCISDAEKAGYHTNSVAKSLVRRLTVKESDKTKEIYLTKDELEALYNMELEGQEEKVRDLFLIGCYTAQRFSDFTSIHKDCIGTTPRGVRVIRMEQQKTGNKVVVPILDEKLETLLKKYNYNVPPISDQVLNRDIKKIAEKLSVSVPSLAVKEKTLLKKQEKLAEERGQCTFERDGQKNVLKPRWQLISTHTARRSAITNMYLSGKYTTPQIMSVSGHHNEDVFWEYVKLSLDEKAEQVFLSSADGMF